MLKVKYSEHAFRDLKELDVKERQFVAEKIEFLARNFDNLKNTKKITELKGSRFSGQYRFTVSKKIRVIFRVEKDNFILLVLKIGKRKDIYKKM